jgi:acetyltransferase-like isoleucine patch superfamily enzyme
MEKGAKIIVNEGCSFGAGSNVEIYKNAILEVGKLNSNAELNIICGEHITLGSPCNIARNATVRDTSGHLLAIAGYKMTKPLTIGNHTWLCTGSTVMPGANIGDGSVIGANSFVTKKIPAFTMTQGNPAIEVGNIKYFRI